MTKADRVGWMVFGVWLAVNLFEWVRDGEWAWVVALAVVCPVAAVVGKHFGLGNWGSKG